MPRYAVTGSTGHLGPLVIAGMLGLGIAPDDIVAVARTPAWLTPPLRPESGTWCTRACSVPAHTERPNRDLFWDSSFDSVGYRRADQLIGLAPHRGPSHDSPAFGRRGPAVGLARGATVVEGRSALDCVVQVQYTVALDNLVGIVEDDGAGVAAEETHSFTQNHRGDIHRDLVDQAC